jgi:hypothetical protein
LDYRRTAAALPTLQFPKYRFPAMDSVQNSSHNSSAFLDSAQGSIVRVPIALLQNSIHAPRIAQISSAPWNVKYTHQPRNIQWLENRGREQEFALKRQPLILISEVF